MFLFLYEVDEIAAKWKHVKTNFHRDVKLEEAGQSHKKRKYVYFNELEFMRPFVGVRLPAKRDNTSIDSLDELMGNDTDIEMDTLLKCNDDYEEGSKLNDSAVAEERITRSSKRIIKPTQKALENKASSSTPVASRIQKESVIKNFEPTKKTASGTPTNASFKIRDGDISFCLSLVPTLRKLSDGRKLRAKIEILKILHKYVDHVERRNLVAKSHHNNNSNIHQNADIEEDLTEDHLEEYDDGIIIKHEDNDDPLHGNNGNNKTWWT